MSMPRRRLSARLTLAGAFRRERGGCLPQSRVHAVIALDGALENKRPRCAASGHASFGTDFSVRVTRMK